MNDHLLYTFYFSGPFWVCATLVFTTAIAGNLASYLINTGDHQWVYDFHKGICCVSKFLVQVANSLYEMHLGGIMVVICIHHLGLDVKFLR